MAKFTGPGKVRDNLNVPPARRQGLFGLLFNFDIEGDVLKKEHTDWLEKNAVPLLRVRGVQVFLKGSASRTGSNFFNQQLSERRVGAVKKFLQSRGLTETQTSLAAVGEEEAALAGKADGTEDELDRAVSVSIRVPRGAGVMRFERLDPANIEDGFEPARSPQWLMVPMFGRRKLELRNGAGVRLVSSKPDQLRFFSPSEGRETADLVVTKERQVIEFAGGTPGGAVVEAQDLATGARIKLLEVSVLFPKLVRIGLNFVTDPQNTNPKRKADTVASMLKEARRIYLDQVNLVLAATSLPPRTVDFKQNLSDPTAPLRNGIRPVTPKTIGTDFHVLGNRRDGSARINTFYLWEWEPDTPDVNAEVDLIGGSLIVFEDDTSSADGNFEGFTFGHEIGHCLGLVHTGTDNPADRIRLMWNTTNQHRGKLTREEILKAHAKA